MCSLEELTPGTDHPRGWSMESTSVKLSYIRSSPSVVLLCWLKWCTESHTNTSPRWRIPAVFLRTTPQSTTTTQRYLLGRHWGHLSLSWLTGRSHIWRAPDKCTQWHWTAPSTRHKLHQSTGTLKPGKNSTSSAWKTQTWQSSFGLEHPLQWIRHPCIRGWASTKPLSKKTWYSAIWQEQGLNWKLPLPCSWLESKIRR